mgnify:CR=1 FL=1
MRYKALESFISFSERIGIFACRGTDLHGGFDTRISKQISKLIATHQLFFVRYTRFC